MRENQYLRDLNLQVPPSDGRRIEVFANGLPFWGGTQIAIDTTVVSALTGCGKARSSTAGKALRAAKRREDVKYAE